MRYVYEAAFEHVVDESGDYWTVDFPDFGGDCFTDGRTVEQAAANAVDVLVLTVASYVEDGWDLPRPTFHEPPLAVVCAEVDERAIEMTKCLTIAQAADELGVSRSRVSQLLSAGRLESREFDGRRMVTIDSVNARKASPPAPHRPRGHVEAA